MRVEKKEGQKQGGQRVKKKEEDNRIGGNKNRIERNRKATHKSIWMRGVRWQVQGDARYLISMI